MLLSAVGHGDRVSLSLCLSLSRHFAVVPVAVCSFCNKATVDRFCCRLHTYIHTRYYCLISHVHNCQLSRETERARPERPSVYRVGAIESSKYMMTSIVICVSPLPVRVLRIEPCLACFLPQQPSHVVCRPLPFSLSLDCGSHQRTPYDVGFGSPKTLAFLQHWHSPQAGTERVSLHLNFPRDLGEGTDSGPHSPFLQGC